MLRPASLAAAALLVWGTLPGAALAARLAPASSGRPSTPLAIRIASGSSLLEPGSRVVVTWPEGTTGPGFDEMELVLSVDGGRTFPLRVSRRIAPSDAGFSWTVPSLPAGHARLALRAGVDSEEDAETIVGLSEDFGIAPSARAEVEQLFRVGEEERTRDALEGVPPPRPDSALGGVPSFVAGSDLPEATGPYPSPDFDFSRVLARRGPGFADAATRPSHPNPSRSVAPIRLPMRL
jgi:hypothetical protein